MSFDPSQVDTVAIAVGAAVWAAMLGAVWLRPRKDAASCREEDFASWKNLNGLPNASFDEFLASEQAPGAYLSRLELSATITAMALLTLFYALRHWAAWQ